MKLVLCTLAICLSILASVFTTKELIRAEGKRVRSALPKALAEPADAAGRPEPALQKLDAIASQLSSLNRRLVALEEAGARQAASLAQLAAPEGARATGLARNAAGLSATLARLDALPAQLTELTAYLDQSFEHLENTVTESTAPQHVTEALDPLSKRLEAIDSYFTPLYAFLGVVYDPASDDLLAAYPSVDVRLNELFLQSEELRKDIAALRVFLTPYNIDPVKRPRD